MTDRINTITIETDRDGLGADELRAITAMVESILGRGAVMIAGSGPRVWRFERRERGTA